jgi:glycosyltransferase involved in cell wall biosynthesis
MRATRTDEQGTDVAIRVAHVTTVDLTHRFLLLGQLRRLREEGFEVTAICAPGPYTDELEAEGIQYIRWPHATRAWDPLADTRAFIELVKILRHERFHIVHTHTPKAGIMGRLAGSLSRVPIVANTVHGFYATKEHSLRRRLPVLTLEWVAARFSDLEFYQSAEDLAWARRLRIATARHAFHLGNGTDLTRFHPDAVSPRRVGEIREELGIPADALVVGTVGRMVVEKGYREFFASAREVRESLPNVRFLAVGSMDASRGDALQAPECAEASRDVVFTGWRTDIPELLAVIDIFVLASWREGLPRSAIEAAAMGKPLILTDIRGCREIVAQGEEGYLVPVRDPKRLAATIRRLVEDEDLRVSMGKRARARAVAQFDERRVGEIIVAQYRDQLARLSS